MIHGRALGALVWIRAQARDRRGWLVGRSNVTVPLTVGTDIQYASALSARLGTRFLDREPRKNARRQSVRACQPELLTSGFDARNFNS
jgi:hypothetical protein